MAVSKRPWPLQRMAELETQHQRLRVAAYNGLGKPKHHHRMRISSQGTHLQLLVTTDAGEAKHQQYKGALSEFCQHLTDKTQLAQSVSAHMLMGQMNRLAQHDPFLKGLRASPKDDGEVAEHVDQQATLAARVRGSRYRAYARSPPAEMSSGKCRWHGGPRPCSRAASGAASCVSACEC